MLMINVNLGIFGHIDHGKTLLAKQLTEIASTSALDKPPESKRRGITIDIGFSSFTLDNYRITLVDAPGHADLIKAVVGAADIIDLALLVVDAREGPKTQTGEHLLILDLFNIPTIVVMNKIDIASEDEIKNTETFMRAILNSTNNLKNAKIVKISAKEGIGIDELKKTLKETLDNMEIKRDVDNYFKMPIDHAFSIKGVGTVVTGTIHKGKVSVGDEMRTFPINVDVKVKGIQCFKKDVNEAYAGDRVGIALQGVEPKQIFRGCVLTSKDTKLEVVDKIVAKVKISEIFKYNITPKMKVHLNVGMMVVPATVVPFQKMNFEGKEVNVILNEVKGGDECYCAFELEEKVVAEIGDRVLITRLDLPPTTLRICGHGEIVEFKGVKELNIKKIVTREGKVVAKKDKLFVEGLASSKTSAEKLIGEVVYVPSKNIKGVIKGTFGTKGHLVVEFDGDVEKGDTVILRRLRNWG
nr:selenocysteine-specific translation elongation factor [Methanotorris igneus]